MLIHTGIVRTRQVDVSIIYMFPAFSLISSALNSSKEAKKILTFTFAFAWCK